MGWVQGRKGVQKVALGETRKNETLARAAVILGIVTTVLSALALVGLILLIALNAGSHNHHHNGPGSGSERAGASCIVAGTPWRTRI